MSFFKVKLTYVKFLFKDNIEILLDNSKSELFEYIGNNIH